MLRVYTRRLFQPWMHSLDATKICRYVTVPRRVYRTLGVLLALAIFTSAIYTILLIHQPPLTDLIKKTNSWRWTDKEEPFFPGVEQEHLLYQLPGVTPP